MYMDFSKDIMTALGHGHYERLPMDKKLPMFFLAYLADPSDSGKIETQLYLCLSQYNGLDMIESQLKLC